MERMERGVMEWGSRPVQLCLPFESPDHQPIWASGPSCSVTIPGGYLPLDVCVQNPRAVMCMLTAARFLGLLNDEPLSLWLGVPLRAYVMKRGAPALRVLRWSDVASFNVGVQDTVVGGARVRHTTPERTVIDLVRYGRHVGGSGIALACLRSYAALGGTALQVREMAHAIRVPAQAKVVLDTLLLSMDGAGS
ncbi:MAG: type IV toxin-antitoxin system AbiEi family antitoxin domain-containing protein [Janthinobacterium lividum]